METRELKFKRAHFKDEAKTQFSHFSEWGVNIGNVQFTSPSSNNFAMYFTDCQYTGLKDKHRKEIYEGDTDENGDAVIWCEERNGWALKTFNKPTNEVIMCHCYMCEGNFELSEVIKDFEVAGNIYEG